MPSHHCLLGTTFAGCHTKSARAILQLMCSKNRSITITADVMMICYYNVFMCTQLNWITCRVSRLAMYVCMHA